METKIGFLDSGIGGITVLNECIKLNSNFEYIYYSDSINNPYGDKTEKFLLDAITRNVDILINKGCLIIVIACNTASVICLDFLKKKYANIFFIPIEPDVKTVYDRQDGTLVMATKATFESKRFNTLLRKYHNDKFYLLPCIGLADIIENGTKHELNDYLEMNLKKYMGKINNVVLGCTHYPLIKKEIKEVLGNVNFFDGSIGVAKQLNKIINENNFVGGCDLNITFIDSSNSKDKEKRFFELLKIES